MSLTYSRRVHTFDGVTHRAGDVDSVEGGSALNENFASVLESVATAIPTELAVVQGDVTRTWGEFDDRASRLAGYLRGQGVGIGDVVVVGMQNRIAHVEALFAIAKLRAVPANLNYRYRDIEIEYLLNDCSAVAAIAEPDVCERVVALGDRVPSVRAVVGAVTSPSTPDVDEVVAMSAPDERIERSGDDRFIIYTGGTTGMPKATNWRQSRLGAIWDGNFAAFDVSVPPSRSELAATIKRIRGSGTATVALPACPLIHATGLHAAMGALVTRGTVAFAPAGPFDPAAVWRTVERHRVNYLVIVGDAFARPLLAELRGASERGERLDLTSLDRIASSGVVWSADVKAGLLEFVDARLVDVLASSEGGPYAISETSRGHVVPTSRFVLAPMARVLDEDGRDIEPGSGRVGLLASSNVAAPDGYLGDETKSAATFKMIDGVRWSIPGDRATIEADGSLVLLGRGSGVINTGGEKVFAEEVENALADHPAVADVIVAPAPDDRWGSIVVAIVQTVDGEPVPEASLTDFITQRLAGYKQPRRYVFVPEIPRSPAGKADRTWATTTATNS